MTHVNPGTDTTINPVVIDDSKRERKHKGMEHCDLASVVFKGDGVAWIKCDEIVGDCFWIINHGNCPRVNTPAHPPEAQQRIDAAITELDRLQIESFEWLEINAYQKAIALLQAGRK